MRAVSVVIPCAIAAESPCHSGKNSVRSNSRLVKGATIVQRSPGWAGSQTVILVQMVLKWVTMRSQLFKGSLKGSQKA
jgi:hypothetical protein